MFVRNGLHCHQWHLGFKTWKHTPTERGFDSHLGYYAGSTDYYTQDSLCWPDSQCFTSFTPTHEPVSGWDLHRDRATITNSTTYSTILYTEEAARIMAAHAAAHTAKSTPLFLYLPYQAVHVGNKVMPELMPSNFHDIGLGLRKPNDDHDSRIAAVVKR